MIRSFAANLLSTRNRAKVTSTLKSIYDYDASDSDEDSW
jgi:hypothetical protein